VIVCIPPGRGIPGGISRSATVSAPLRLRGPCRWALAGGTNAARSGPVAISSYGPRAGGLHQNVMKPRTATTWPSAFLTADGPVSGATTSPRFVA